MNIIESNGIFRTANFTGVHEQLPAGNYLLKFDPREGYYLSKQEAFRLPKKLYGDHSIINRWIKSYENNSEKNLGIILNGIKGSGKTITAQKLCIDSGKAVIIINEPFLGSDFLDFITSFPDAIIFIDEFEKVYSDQKQSTDLLSLMDGNFATRFIFLLTVNEMRINSFLMNRLNRIKYRKDYGDLDDATMQEVIDDMLDNKEHTDSIYKFFKKVGMRTFDLLVNIIKEMNLFEEDALTCAAHLNLESESRIYEFFEMQDGKLVEHEAMNLKGDMEQFTVSRNQISLATQAFIKERSLQDMDFDADPYWGIDVDLTTAKITTIDETKVLLEGMDGDMPYKLIMKPRTSYRITF